MPSSATAKIGLEPRVRRAVLLLGVAGVALFLTLLLWPKGVEDGTRQVRIGDHTYRLAVADTQAEQVRGLSGREHVALHGGMLFIYQQPERVCLWMKDMRVPIDMVWLDSGKHVIHIEHSVQPNTYPQTFCPNALTRYVIELKAGQANAERLEVGDILNF